MFVVSLNGTPSFAAVSETDMHEQSPKRCAYWVPKLRSKKIMIVLGHLFKILYLEKSGAHTLESCTLYVALRQATKSGQRRPTLENLLGLQIFSAPTDIWLLPWTREFQVDTGGRLSDLAMVEPWQYPTRQTLIRHKDLSEPDNATKLLRRSGD